MSGRQGKPPLPLRSSFSALVQRVLPAAEVPAGSRGQEKGPMQQRWCTCPRGSLMQGGSGENGEIPKRDQGEIAFLRASDQLDNRGEGFKFKNRDGSVDFADSREVEIMGFGTRILTKSILTNLNKK